MRLHAEAAMRTTCGTSRYLAIHSRQNTYPMNRQGRGCFCSSAKNLPNASSSARWPSQRYHYGLYYSSLVYLRSVVAGRTATFIGCAQWHLFFSALYHPVLFGIQTVLLAQMIPHLSWIVSSAAFLGVIDMYASSTHPDLNGPALTVLAVKTFVTVAMAIILWRRTEILSLLLNRL